MKMGLVNKLTELDQYIWKQYEKVTQYCNRKYGWDKYDLKTISEKTVAVAFAGAGTYETIIGFSINSLPFLAIGLLTGAGSIHQYFKVEADNKKERKEELEQISRTGAVKEPRFSFERPTLLAGSTVFDGVGVAVLYASDNGPATALGLLGIALGASVLNIAVSSYFQDQILTPPKKKKSVFKTFYEKVTGKLQPAPPQLEPVRPNKYQSIDDLVAGE